MVQAQTCHTEAEIRRVLGEHIEELVREKQEVRIAWKTGPGPMVCIITGCEPPKKEQGDEYADTLWVFPGGEVVYITTPGEITHFEILPTRQQMTPRLAMEQMDEMERVAGLKCE